MTALLQEIQRALTDLLLSGLSTGGPAAIPRLHALSMQCEDMGLHTGSALLTEIESALSARAHALEKDDLPLSTAICRMAHYVALCRERQQADAIVQRWQELLHRGEELPIQEPPESRR